LRDAIKTSHELDNGLDEEHAVLLGIGTAGNMGLLVEPAIKIIRGQQEVHKVVITTVYPMLDIYSSQDTRQLTVELET
jgi:hypothetical protein